MYFYHKMEKTVCWNAQMVNTKTLLQKPVKLAKQTAPYVKMALSVTNAVTDFTFMSIQIQYPAQQLMIVSPSARMEPIKMGRNVSLVCPIA
jgi:hypothetical protein